MKKKWAGIGVGVSALVILLGILVLSGAIFSLDYGVSSFTPYGFGNGFSKFGGDAYTVIANNAAATAAHVNNLYETIVRLCGIFMIIFGTGGVCLFRILGEEPKTTVVSAQRPEAVPAFTSLQTLKTTNNFSSKSVSDESKMGNNNTPPNSEDSKKELEREVSGGSNLKDAKVGDTIFFGAYQQKLDLGGKKTNIEWLVIDKENDSICLLSKYILDCKPYNSIPVNVTWDNCSLRKWLNDDFFKTAFNENEQNMIESCVVPGDKNTTYGTSYDNDSEDNVFLLSATEVNDLLSEHVINSKCTPTDSLRGYWNEIGEGKGWWLRTPGRSLDYATCFENAVDGSIDYTGDYVNTFNNGIRPAVRVTIE